MPVQSQILLKGELANTLAAAALQLDKTNPANPADAAYRIGFQAALETVATAHGINLPQLRNAQAEARRAATALTAADDRM